MDVDTNAYRLPASGRVDKVALIAGVVGLAASIAGYKVNADQFAHSYLVSLWFWLSISLGALFFVMTHHVVHARWSVVVRRVVELLALTLPEMLFLALPLIGLLLSGQLHGLYPWSDPAQQAQHHVLQIKAAGWLNPNFFAARIIIYLVIWCAFAGSLYRSSRQQDKASSAANSSFMSRLSAPGLVIFAFSFTLAVFDLIMSTEPLWYSTIFGVYCFSLAALAMYCLLILTLGHMQRHGALVAEVTTEHYHDLGKWVFAWICFFAYVAFAQYLLIWYAHIPEEVEFYSRRFHGGWLALTVFLLFAQVLLPFLILMGRRSKRHRMLMMAMSAWLLVMYWLHLYWLVMPGLHVGGPAFSWQDVTTFVGIGGICVWAFARRLAQVPVVPVGDPELRQSMAFVNH